MAQKKWVVSLSAFLLIVLLFTGYLAVAAELGSQNDPLVTASYINEEFIPGLSKKIDDAIALRTKDYSENMNKQYNDLMANMQTKVNEFNRSFSGDMTDPAFVDAVAKAVIEKQGGSTSAGSGGDAMKKVVVPKGKTVMLSMGSEVMLRLGAATVVADGAPGLIDLTTGGSLDKGKALERSHLYVSTVEARGFKVTEEATVFVRGPYTVS